jgi:hypothetical protein
MEVATARDTAVNATFTQTHPGDALSVSQYHHADAGHERQQEAGQRKGARQ